MRVLVGDETGLLKSIELEKNEQHVVSSRKEPQARVHGIQSMCWYEDETQDTSSKENVVVARGNGIVENYSSAHGKSAATSSREANWQFTAPTGKTTGIGMIQKFGSVVRCTDAGDVFVKNMLSESAKPSTFSVGANIHRMRIEPKEQTHIAVGGNERDLNIWSLEKQECVFKAKNVTHDNLDMRVPVWVKDLRFLSQGSSNGHRVVVGTGYQHVRIYDTNTKRRPVQELKFGEYPINALCVSPDETRVYIADTAGNLDILDLRTLKHMGRCTGPVGAIRDIACHPTLPYIAAVGLDRFVHVFDVNTRKYQHNVYAKQRLNTVMFCDDGVKDIPKPVEEPAAKKRKTDDDEEFGGDDDDEEEEDEEAYEGLELSEEEEEEDDDDDDDDDDDEEGSD
uniref:Anaphase-promoting complex subunit 4 WD40 domain-containing protein n=1 Tax=Globisporangium ultimum (strain ATCC 200006 / CBS 805.95 / DAOM BR144) TaxID=431595 RepID=K3WS22_GLOUD